METVLPPPDETDNAGVVIVPPLVFGGALILSLLFYLIYPFGIGIDIGITGPILGLLMCGGGVALLLACWSLYKTNNVSIRPDRPISRLIESGPYNYTRNPIYLAMLVIYVGFALITGIGWLYVFLPSLWAYLEFYVIAREEAYMIRRFGEDYIGYMRRAGRWI